MSEKSLTALTAKEFEIDSASISLSSEYRNLPNWSSLNALIFISSINDHFDVLLSSADLSNTKTLGDIYKLIQERN